MNLRQIATRSLRHYWSTNLAIALGVAAATAVLTGALIVGESMRNEPARLDAATTWQDRRDAGVGWFLSQ